MRRNYSHHVYYGGWSQGNNFELDGATVGASSTTSSTAARGRCAAWGASSATTWCWKPATSGCGPTKTNASIHHNIFVGGDADIGGIYVALQPHNVRIFNNTIDGLGKIGLAVLLSEGIVSLTSNLFTNVPSGVIQITGAATLTADYNFFSGAPMVTPTVAAPRTTSRTWTRCSPSPQTVVFDIDEVGIWRRTITVRDVLSTYRTRYTPKTGSPVIDEGDPAGGSGNDIGAVGAGTANAMDKFGVLP